MKVVAKRVVIALCVLCFSVVASANSVSSGDGCKNARAPQYDIEKHRMNIHDMAIRLFESLDDNARRVAIVARAGADISGNRFRNPKWQKYTHAALAWKHSRDGLWRFKHLLNICAGPSSDIFVQNLVQFFNDDPYFYDFRLGVPSIELQERIAGILEDEGAPRMLHNPRYSNIANPFKVEYQNSNGWLLGVIASAQSGLKTYEEVQRYYGRAGYKPSQVRVGFFRQLGAGFVANATLEDHPPPSLGGWFNFVSAASLYQYIADTDELLVEMEICHAAGCNIPVWKLNNGKDPTRGTYRQEESLK